MASIRDLINDDQEMEPPSHHAFASNTHPESSPSSHSRSHSYGHHGHSHHHHSQHTHHFQPYPSHHHHGSHSHHHPQEPHQPHYPPHPQGYPQEYYNQSHTPPPPPPPTHPGPQYYQPSPYASREAPPRAFDPIKAEIAQHQQQPLHQSQQPHETHRHRGTPHTPSDASPIVRIKIVQQPLHARMCGFGEKDRRPVDPPPIVQLFFGEEMASLPPKVVAKQRGNDTRRRRKTKAAKHKPVHSHARSNSHDADVEGHNGDEDEEDESYQLEDDDDDDLPRGARAVKQEPGSEVSSSAYKPEDRDHKGPSEGSPSGSEGDDLDENDDEYEEEEDEQDPLFVLHVSLWSHDGTEVRNMIATPGQSDPPKLTRILMGSLVVSPILLNNPEGVPGWYFSFPDLSIRTEGVYTLKFSLMRFGSFDFLSGDEGQQASTLVAEETSEPFTVFSAKKFPGMTESTELSKAFAKQGLKIPIRNDLRVRKNADKD